MSKREIPFGRPTLGPEEIEAVAAVLRGPQLVHGPVGAELEARFAQRAGVRHAVSVSSCTTGLHLSLACAGIGPGDRVVVPAMTHVATAHAVEHTGATPLFVDIDPITGNMDPAATVDALESGASAAIVVHYLGLPVEFSPIEEAAERTGATVIEDCALAIDATYDGRKAGTLGRSGSFSFYPAKHMTTAEGGMVTTNDEDFAASLRRRRAFGYDKSLGERTRPGVYDVDVLGWNYRMSEVHAAIGLVQLDRLDELQGHRARNFDELRNAVMTVEGVHVPPSVHGRARSSHYCLNVVLPRDGSIPRDIVVNEFRAQGIGTSVHYPGPVPLFTYYRDRYGYEEGAFPVAEWFAQQTISLPVGPHLLPGDVERIAAALRRGVDAARSITATDI